MQNTSITDIISLKMTDYCLNECRFKSNTNRYCKCRRMRYKLNCPHYAVKLCEEINNAHYLSRQAMMRKCDFTQAAAARMSAEEQVERAKQVLKQNGYSGTLQKTIEFTI